jgi:hypothetical protein
LCRVGDDAELVASGAVEPVRASALGAALKSVIPIARDVGDTIVHVVMEEMNGSRSTSRASDLR